MKILFLNELDLQTLENLNLSGNSARQLFAPSYLDGYFLTADLLTDCDVGQTWEYYEKFLKSLPQLEIDVKDLVKKNEIE